MLEHARVIDGRMVLDGAFGVVYNINSLYEIDGNLSDLRWRPDHPDIDRLLDARKWVPLLQGSGRPA